MKEYVKLANKVIDEYCKSLDVPREVLNQKKTTKKVRRYKDTNVAFMRQSLGHYLYKRLPLYALDVARLVGYADHSMISLYSKIVETNLEMNDMCFIPYYRKLEEIAEPIIGELGFERVGAFHFKNVKKPTSI